MEYKHRIVQPEDLMEQLLPLLEEAEAIPLVISGTSMTPFLAPGRDTLYLSKVKRPLRKGDMVLYQRTAGNYVLHRILRVEGDTCAMIGDAQNVVEPGIRSDQICAVATAVRRKEKLLKAGDFWWEFFRVVWIRMIPLRSTIWKVWSALHG